MVVKLTSWSVRGSHFAFLLLAREESYMKPSTVWALAHAVRGYDTARVTPRSPIDQPISQDLVHRLVLAIIAEKIANYFVPPPSEVTGANTSTDLL
jgi:hypothetical protein